jgi:hypothetical protein
VIFELRSAWCRRLRNATYLLHPFALLQGEAVVGNVVKLLEVELLERGSWGNFRHSVQAWLRRWEIRRRCGGQ